MKYLSILALAVALAMTAAPSTAHASDWYVWDDGMGNFLWCRVIGNQLICIPIEQIQPIDP